MLACFKGHKAVAKLLLDHFIQQNIDLDPKDVEKAYVWACEKGRKGVIELLLEHPKTKHLDPNVEVEEAHHIKNHGFVSACRRGHKNVVKLLLDHPNSQHMDFNAKHYGCTGLMDASIDGRMYGWMGG